MTLNYEKWLYGLIGDMVRGGANAVTAGVTVSAMDPKDYNFLSSRFYILLLAVFAVHAVMSLMKYLEKTPLPEIVTTTTIEERSPHSTMITNAGEEVRSEHQTTITKTVEEVKPSQG